MTERDWEYMIEEMLLKLSKIKDQFVEVAEEPKADILLKVGRHDHETGRWLRPEVSVRMSF